MTIKEKTKELIISKTKELISRHTDITIKEIAEACFINIAAVNYYFGTKDNLISIVIKSIVDKLQQDIYDEIIKIDNSTNSIEEAFSTVLDIIYNFAVKNPGVVRYLILGKDPKDETRNGLLEPYFTENKFTLDIYKRIGRLFNTTDSLVLYAKYLLLFSSMIMPLFISLTNSKDEKGIFTLENKDFKKIYTDEILRLIR
jgi:AcrR family transcriptional regulator